MSQPQARYVQWDDHSFIQCEPIRQCAGDDDGTCTAAESGTGPASDAAGALIYSGRWRRESGVAVPGNRQSRLTANALVAGEQYAADAIAGLVPELARLVCELAEY